MMPSLDDEGLKITPTDLDSQTFWFKHLMMIMMTLKRLIRHGQEYVDKSPAGGETHVLQSSSKSAESKSFVFNKKSIVAMITDKISPQNTEGYSSLC